MGKYIKTRLRWSSGIDPWVFTYVSDNFSEPDLKEHASDMNFKWSYSEHYRGCKAVFADRSEVDNRTIRGEIVRCEHNIERLTKKRSDLFNMLLEKQIEGIISSRSK